MTQVQKLFSGHELSRTNLNPAIDLEQRFVRVCGPLQEVLLDTNCHDYPVQ